MATRQAGGRPGQLATMLTAVTAGLLAPAAAATAAFANPIPVGDGGTAPVTPARPPPSASSPPAAWQAGRSP